MTVSVRAACARDSVAGHRPADPRYGIDLVNNGEYGHYMGVTYTEPTLDQLATVLGSYSQQKADTSLAYLLSVTGGAVDLVVYEHRNQLRRWLNKWVCRLRYPLPGEPDAFSDSLLQWWPTSGTALPNNPIAELSDAEVGAIADSYADLSAQPGALITRRGVVTGHRSIGPTAASKIMFVLRPDTIPPWDAAIARTTTGGTSSIHFASHLKAARAWAQGVRKEGSRQNVADIATHVGRPGSSLARLRDEWMYLTITRHCPVPRV
jgi:hypothetical protein